MRIIRPGVNPALLDLLAGRPAATAAAFGDLYTVLAIDPNLEDKKITRRNRSKTYSPREVAAVKPGGLKRYETETTQKPICSDETVIVWSSLSQL